jgi:hypothetical protein
VPRPSARRAVSDPSSRMSVTVQRSPLRTHPRGCGGGGRSA